MHEYEVVEGCYVPVGPGFKFKKPGQVVRLRKADAKKLGSYVKPLDDPAEAPVDPLPISPLVVSPEPAVVDPPVEVHDHAVDAPADEPGVQI